MVETIAEIVGGLYGVASLIAAVAPKAWRVTQWCARHAADIRGVQQWLARQP